MSKFDERVIKTCKKEKMVRKKHAKNKCSVKIKLVFVYFSM